MNDIGSSSIASRSCGTQRSQGLQGLPGRWVIPLDQWAGDERQRMDYEPAGGVMAPPVPPEIPAPQAAFFDARRARLPSRRDLVPRRRLVRRLIASRETPLVLIAAPAGYGKTSLLAEWAEVDERPFAWVTLDEPDNDVVHLMMAIVDALAEIDPIEAATTSQRSSRLSFVEDFVLRRLACLLDAQREPFVIVLDNAHVLDTPDALTALGTIARNLPAGSQLALSSRTLPAVHLGRLRADHQLVELRALDLAMTAPEAAMLLEAAGLPLDIDHVEALVRRAEGWPVALYLAALSLRNEPNVAGAVSRFAGDDDFLSDYIREEVIDGLAPESVDFLMRSSILAQLSGSLCDVVLARSDSGTLLQNLARHELLLVPLDRCGECYRCPGPLRAVLQRELGMHDPGLLVELHRRASIWHADRGQLDRAIAHAVAGNDRERAGELLWMHLPFDLGRAHGGTVCNWLRSFSDEELAGDAALSLCSAHVCLAAGDLASAEHWAMAADAALKRSSGGARAQSLSAGVALLGACVARHGVVRMGEDAATAYELESAHSPWRALCRLCQGVAAQLTGDPLRARVLLDDGAHRSAAVMPYIETLCLAQLAIIDVGDGDWEVAEDRCAQAGALIRRHTLDGSPTSALALALTALVNAQTGRADRAKESLRDCTQLLAEVDRHVAWYGVEVRIVLARAAARLTDVSRASTLLAEASRAARRVPDAPVLNCWLDEAVGELDSRAAAALEDSSSLTLAELRILRFLPTHLSFREIGDRLHVSTNTVKSQAHAVYRKLGACSRSDAVARASRVGLIWSLPSSPDI